jgi:hypothetical protein
MIMNLDINLSNVGKKWVSCFDRLGFKIYLGNHSLVDAFCDMRWCLNELEFHGQLNGVQFAWFSDTFLLYTSDDSRDSFCAIDEAARGFFDELVDAGIPLRGAMAFGDFYADKTGGIFLGNALVDAYEYGQKFDWLGFALHGSALKRMEEVGISTNGPYYKRSVVKSNFSKRLLKCLRKLAWFFAPKRLLQHAASASEVGGSEQETVVAYLVGLSSPLPLDGRNPYLQTVEEMESCAEDKRHKIKYLNTVQFNKTPEASKRPPRPRPQTDG